VLNAAREVAGILLLVALVERQRIAEIWLIRQSPPRAREWVEHDDAKPAGTRNEGDKNDIAMMLMIDRFFS
jgi:hypothetical protein